MTEIEMTGLLLKMADMGITGVFISYDGSGDSGSIDSITYTDNPNVSCMEDLENIYDHGMDDQTYLNQLDGGLYMSIEDFAYASLLDDIEDWYNNEGGFGYVIIHVKTGQYKIFNSVRITETEDYIHEGDLLKKTEE
jgi:hypothetical protein